MSLPAVDSQPTLFGSIASVARDLFAEDDRYRLFARKVWPVLAGTRAGQEKGSELNGAKISAFWDGCGVAGRASHGAVW